MRTTFIKYLTQAAEQDETIYLVVGDVGFSVVEEFKEKFPTRFINAGIAEQNMIGLAAGLAITGKKVFAYSTIPFITMRCFEQIRIDICYQNLPIKLVGVGGGFSYAQYGLSHHAVEDVAIMRALPEMTVIAPGSKYEAAQLMPQFVNHQGPAYLRLSNNEELVQYNEKEPVTLGKILDIIPNENQLILASSNALDLAFLVCSYLNQQGISIGLASVHTIKPLDANYFINKSGTLKALFTIEEHSVIGGLGEAVASIISQQIDHHIIFKMFGINDFYFHTTGTRKDLLSMAGLTVEQISQTIMELSFNGQPAQKGLSAVATIGRRLETACL